MPATSRTTARNAVMTLFKTAWDGVPAPVPAVVYDDVNADDVDGLEEYARVQMRHADGRQATLGNESGNRRFRRFGTIVVQVYTPFGEGQVRSDTLVQAVIEAFEGATTATDGVLFRNVRSQEVGRDAAWWLVNVLADFEYDEVR